MGKSDFNGKKTAVYRQNFNVSNTRSFTKFVLLSSAISLANTRFFRNIYDGRIICIVLLPNPISLAKTGFFRNIDLIDEFFVS